MAINNAVSKGLSKVREERKMVVYYEDFCQNPAHIFAEIGSRLGFDVPYAGPEDFSITRTGKLEHESEIRRALASF
jgi:hypothetical protein